MSPVPRRLATLGDFLRTPSVNRTVVGLLTLAIGLLLVANIATFVMIRRTLDFNTTVDHTQQVRLTGREVLIQLVNAETGQRGFLLTGRPNYLAIHEEAVAALPDVTNTLVGLVGDNPAQTARAEQVRRLSEDRISVMSSSIDLARQGRGAEAVSIIRTGRGKAIMDQLRVLIEEMDQVERVLQERRTARSERSAFTTVLVNAGAGALILALGFISLILIRRSVADIQTARDAVEQANLTLEEKVRARTSALSRANEEIQRFAYIVSHDLRAPLVNVMGYTSELEQAGRTIDQQMTKVETLNPDIVENDALVAVREDVPEAIGFIRASTEKMDRLINAILKLSREGRRTLTPETLDMTALCQRIADSVQHQTEEADAAIEVGDLPGFESDRLSIEQVFGNLIDNAVKYLDASRPGLISVTGEDVAGGWVEFAISDNGRGISDRDHERIFELFRRSGRQDRPGEGLGLAFVRNSVRRLGGAIDIESELGKGSTFRLKFPKRLVLSVEEDDA